MAALTGAAQEKFASLRRRLDQLGYRQPLTIESLPLVEKLFGDLIHTTESLRRSKLQFQKDVKESRSSGPLLDPYKNDNARLARENAELHRKLIQVQDSTNEQISDLKATVRKLEHENNDLRFLNNQYVHKVRVAEREAKSKADRILQLQEKNFQAVVQTPGGRKKTLPFRRQRMTIDNTLDPQSSLSADNIQRQATDPFVADLLKVADKRIAQLSSECDAAKQEKDILDKKLTNLRKQLDTRDDEIDRLGNMLQGGRPTDVVTLESRNKSNEQLISHLNIQVDYLQQRNRELERQLSQSLAEETSAKRVSRELDFQKTELEEELKDVDREARDLQFEKESVKRQADRELNETRFELERSRGELEGLDLENVQMKGDRARLMDDNISLKSRLNAREADYQRLQELVDRIQEDKRRLSSRVTKLTANERELVMEIERLKQKKAPARKTRGKSPNRLGAFLKGVEEERDYWKGEVETLQRMLQNGPSRSLSPSRGRSPTRIRSPTRSISSPVLTPSKKERTDAHFETIIRVLEEERDHYKREYEILRSLRSSRPSSPTRSPPTRDRSTNDETELMRVIRERDELQTMLDKFERHMAEIQTNVKVLTSERDKLNLLYEDTKDELQRTRHQVLRSPKSPKVSLAAQAVLRRVENERDDAIADLRRMTTERDTLRERLKIATETQISDRARLEQRIEDLEMNTKQVAGDNEELVSRVTALKDANSDLDIQLKEQASQNNDLRDECAQQRATATQMRLLAEQAEKALADTQQRLMRKEADCLSTDERCQRLQARIEELQMESQQLRDEISQLRSTVSALDREKDALQAAVDEKTERIVIADEDLVARDKLIDELKIQIGEAEGQLEHSGEMNRIKDRELVSLRRQLEKAQEEFLESQRGREVALRENRRLQDDLGVMTKENQSLNVDLQETVDDREALREQVQDYIQEVKRTEELLAAKEDERTDLLNQYRSLTLEAEKYSTQTHQLESQTSGLRLELATRESETRRLLEKIDNLEHEIREHLHAQQAYESQISQLTRSVSKLEDNVRVVEEERANVQQDLAAARDLCTKLEVAKDTLQRQMGTKELEHEQLQNVVEDAKHEAEILRSQMNSERASVRNLESLLQQNREKEFQSQLGAQEKGAEIQLLRDRLTLNESKMESQQREISTLRSRNVELESDVDRLRRQLTGERFERERTIQELRRHGLTPPPGDSTRGMSRLAKPHSPRSPSRASSSPSTSFNRRNNDDER